MKLLNKKLFSNSRIMFILLICMVKISFALPFSMKFKFVIQAMSPGLFSELTINSFLNDNGRTIPLSGSELHLGGQYVTPMLEVGDFDDEHRVGYIHFFGAYRMPTEIGISFSMPVQIDLRVEVVNQVLVITDVFTRNTGYNPGGLIARNPQLRVSTNHHANTPNQGQSPDFIIRLVAENIVTPSFVFPTL